jgi:hypothetical protein
MQIAMPLRLSSLGFGLDVIVQARGAFEKHGGGFVFVPSELYLGSWPVHQLPSVQDMVFKRFLTKLEVPGDLAAAWSKVNEIALEGATVRLTTQ